MTKLGDSKSGGGENERLDGAAHPRLLRYSRRSPGLHGADYCKSLREVCYSPWCQIAVAR